MPWAAFWIGGFSKNEPIPKSKTAGNVLFPAVFPYFFCRKESIKSTAQLVANMTDNCRLLEPGSPGNTGIGSQTAANKSKLTAKQTLLSAFDFTAAPTWFLHNRSAVNRENTPVKYKACKYARYVRLTYRFTSRESGASTKTRTTLSRNNPIYQRQACFDLFKFSPPPAKSCPNSLYAADEAASLSSHRQLQETDLKADNHFVINKILTFFAASVNTPAFCPLFRLTLSPPYMMPLSSHMGY